MRGDLRSTFTTWLLAVPAALLLIPGLSGAGRAQERQAPAPAVASASPSPDRPATLPAGVPDYAGLRVREVQLRGVAGESLPPRMRDLIVQSADAPLERENIRRSLRALYATGLYSDVRAEAERTAQNEIILVFIAQVNYFVGMVNVEGAPRRPAAHQLVNASKLQLGELYGRDKGETALRNLHNVMMDNGYYQAEIVRDEKYHPETQLVDITFHISPKRHAVLGSLKIEGQAGYLDDRVAQITGFRSGKTITGQRTAKGVQKLRRKYQKQGRLEAQVGIKERNYRADGNTVEYLLHVDQGPKVDIRVSGAKVDAGKLRKLVPVFEEGTVDDDLLNEGLRNLRDYFQTQGYFDVRVGWQRQADPERRQLDVIYQVELGAKHTLVDVRIEGNSTFDAELIRERMQVKPATRLLNHGWFSESLLNRDVQVIEQTLYKANGFPRVKIEPALTDNYQGVPSRLLLTLRITEGPQITVGKVSFLGNASFDRAALESQLAAEGAGLLTIPGQPFSDVHLAQDRDVLLGFYVNHGFPDVQVETLSTPQAGDAGPVDVVFSIAEGQPVYVDRILISGLDYTRSYVVRRELQVRPGAPLSQLSMVDTQRALYDLGLFNQVDLAVQNPEGNARFKNVLLRLSEAKRWTFNYGIGFEVQSAGQPVDVVNSAPAPGIRLPNGTIPSNGGIPLETNPGGGTTASPSISFEVIRGNFRGRDDTISFKTHLGNLQKRGLFSYSAPHWFDREGLRLTFTGLYDNSRDVRTFASERLEGAAQVERVLTRRADGQPVETLLFRYSYRRVKVDPRTLAISTPLIPLLSKPVLLGMPSFTYIRDQRDNVLDTTRGSYTTLDFGVSAKAFGSGSVHGTSLDPFTPTATAANFTRTVAQNATYTTLWRSRRSTREHSMVLARSTRIGTESVFGGGPTGLAIPLPERFFGGGANAHRGFALNQAGPRDLNTGFPLGGNAVFFNSFELRLPPPTLPIVGDNLSLVVFHDAGNVFQSGAEMMHSFRRWKQPQASLCRSEDTHQQCRFDYMSQAFGMGVRYKTPIGPVRADISYNLSPPSFPYYVQCPSTDSAGKGWPCAALPPNALVFQHGTLRHFNFFFSIGQSF